MSLFLSFRRRSSCRRLRTYTHLQQPTPGQLIEDRLWAVCVDGIAEGLTTNRAAYPPYGSDGFELTTAVRLSPAGIAPSFGHHISGNFPPSDPRHRLSDGPEARECRKTAGYRKRQKDGNFPCAVPLWVACVVQCGKPRRSGCRRGFSLPALRRLRTGMLCGSRRASTSEAFRRGRNLSLPLARKHRRGRVCPPGRTPS